MRSEHDSTALLALYARPSTAPERSLRDWQAVLGASRRSRVLAHLSLRLAQAGVEGAIDRRVLGHIRSVRYVVRHQRQMIRWELHELAHALRAVPGPIVLLKGAAYIAGELPLATARLAADVDVLAVRRHLPEIEQGLRNHGWRAAELVDYDERYYREWSHEIPPLTHPERQLEVDVHHAITPAMRGAGIDTEKLIEKSVAVEFDGCRRFRVLQPVDQLIHCALHTFKDSDLALRLRESMDFDLLYRHYAERDPELPDRLVARAIELEQPRSVWWSIHFARRWLGSPIPERTLAELPSPAAATVRAMTWLCDRAMLPGARMERSGLDRIAAMVLLVRYHHHRLPLAKLLPHLLEKSKRRLLQPKEAPDAL